MTQTLPAGGEVRRYDEADATAAEVRCAELLYEVPRTLTAPHYDSPDAHCRHTAVSAKQSVH